MDLVRHNLACDAGAGWNTHYAGFHHVLFMSKIITFVLIRVLALSDPDSEFRPEMCLEMAL
jgi:hypothetical protein